MQDLWKLREQVVQVMGVCSQKMVQKHHRHLTLEEPGLFSMSSSLKRSDQRCRAGNEVPISKKRREASHCASLSEVILNSRTSLGGMPFSVHHEKVP